MNANDFLGLLPELVVVLTALLAIVVDVAAKEKNASASQGVTIIGLAVAGALVICFARRERNADGRASFQ